jgi:hypothetical protein
MDSLFFFKKSCRKGPKHLWTGLSLACTVRSKKLLDLPCTTDPALEIRKCVRPKRWLAWRICKAQQVDLAWCQAHFLWAWHCASPSTTGSGACHTKVLLPKGVWALWFFVIAPRMWSDISCLGLTCGQIHYTYGFKHNAWI